MIISFIGATVKFIIGLVALALFISAIMWVGQHPHVAGNHVQDFIGSVWDTISGWFTFGGEIVD